MPPEPPGRAFPRDPDRPPGTGGVPTFRGAAEQVDERTGRTSVGPEPERRIRPDDDEGPPSRGQPPRGQPRRVRARKVQRVVRHVEPWSVLKLAVLFFGAIFVIVCIASALLWSAARSSGAIENVESFITSVGGFGNCEPIEGTDGTTTTTTTPEQTSTTLPVDQIDPETGDTTLPEEEVDPQPDEDEDCPDGEELVGDFKFEDGRIFQAFALGGAVLVLAGAAAAVVLVLLFNLMSDLTGGLRVTVIEEESGSRRPRDGGRSGSPPPQRRE